MAIRQRAIGAEDKEERQQALLDAAERLLLRSPERMASVAEVADEAGLAKGTVYLYFPSKEELLLALHERNVGGFFTTQRTYAFVTECFGTVARVVSQQNELSAEFDDAAEVWRLSP